MGSPLQMTPVQSSNIAAVSYDEGTAQLYVRFVSSGATYRYDGVPPGVHEDLMSAGSVGSFFAQHIKDAYRAERVG